MDIIKNIKMVISVIVLGISSLAAQQYSGIYDFPIKPGTPEWKELKSYDEMKKVCQLPEEVLESISTNDLIETCLNYPLYMNILAFDKIQSGFNSVTSGFNGLQELLKRKDVGLILFEKYKKMGPELFDQNWSLLKKGEYGSKFYFLEFLFAQESVLSKLETHQRILLLKECLNKTNKKKKYPEVYGILNFGSGGLLVGRILMVEKYINSAEVDEKIKYFLEDGLIPESHFIQEIFEYASQYLLKNE